MLDMWDKLNTTPSMVLETEQDLLEAIQTRPWIGKKHPFQYRVRSNFLVNLIEEMRQTDRQITIPCVQDHLAKHVWDRPDLQYIKRTNDHNTEASALGTMIYNAFNFSREDYLIKNGYVICTEEMLQAAAEKKKQYVVSEYNRVYVPRYVGGKLYAMHRKSRTKYWSEVIGSPVKFVDKKACPLL